MSYQVLARKYRPQTFDEVIGQEHITRTLKNGVEAKRIAHGFLFAGMRGVGKTTMARILAKALNCEKGPTANPCNACEVCREITQGYSMDVIEIDGASNTGVDDIRELRENVLYAPARARYKVYIIDEVHMLSKSAFNALLKTLEEPPEHVVFIFATTESHKVPVTIQSRCQCFHFRKIGFQQIAGQLLFLAKSERVQLDDRTAQLIARASEGSMRDAQSLLDQVVSFCGDTVTLADAKVVLGQIDQEILEQCTEALIQQDSEQALAVVDDLSNRGLDLLEFCKALQSRLRDLLMIKMLKEPRKVLSLADEEIATLKPRAQRIEEDRLLAFLEHLNRAEEEVRRSTHGRFVLEVALIKMTRIEPLQAWNEVIKKMEELEARLGPGGGSSGMVREPEAVRPAAPGPIAGEAKETPTTLSSRTGGAIDWDRVVHLAQQENPVIGAVLEHSFLEKEEKGVLVVGFKKTIHYEMALAKAAKVADVLQRTIKRDLKIEFRVHEQKESGGMSPQEKREAVQKNQQVKRHRESLDNRVIREALKVFNGKILEVREFDKGSKAQPQERA
ncbi:MAG: DNA polymerase III subunit gamma/tau [bacterium]|nr:DNA polymerase III subunit gamma/tau [bacterium]